MSDSSSPLRVRRLALSRFKAYTGSAEQPVSIDIDNADIVLIVGANGRGKTSVVEALELAITGEYQSRIDLDKVDKNSTENTYHDLIHADGVAMGSAERCATVFVDWASVEGAPLGTEKVTIETDKLVPAGPLHERRKTPGFDLTRVRATTLFYAESIHGMLGGNHNARRMLFDAFLGDLPEVKTLAEQIKNHLVPLIEDGKNVVVAARADVNDATRRAAAAAEDLERAWSSTFGARISLVKAGGKWSELNLKRGLATMGKQLDVEITGVPLDDLRSLERETEQRAAHDREDQFAAAGGPALMAWTRVRQALMDYERASQGGPDLADLTLDTVERELDEVTRAVEESTEQEKSLREQIAQIWSTAEFDGPDGHQRLSTGTLPLLLLLARPEGATVASTLGLVPDPDALASQTAHERARLVTLRSELEQEQKRVLHGTKRRRDIEAQQRLLFARGELMEAWSDATSGDPVPSDVAGRLDREPIKTRVERQLGRQTSTPDWSRLAQAFGRLGDANEERESAEKAAEDSPASSDALSQLKALAEVASNLASDKAGLYTSVRARLSRGLFQRKFNEVTRAVLATYDHHDRVRRGLNVDFSSDGALQVRVKKDGAHPSLATGPSSLSRSQLISVSFALAIAANLGQEQPPIGFICLDDIADALDVDNLAAEATLLRRLAYSSDARRQIIITSHNRELTDRLVPLLLPPPGRKMRVVEVTERRDGDLSEVYPEVFKVQSDKQESWTGQSPLKAILPPRRER